MKLMQKAAFAVALAAQSYAYGSVVTVDFDVTINAKQVVGKADEPIAPMEHQFASMTFDNTLISVDRNWNTPTEIYSHVWSNFGQATIVSPLSDITTRNLIPQAVVTGTSVMESSLSYQLAPPTYSTVSFGHVIYAASTMASETHPNGLNAYAGENWSRTVSIASPIQYLGPMDQVDIAAYNFTSDDLMAYLVGMKSTAGQFEFSDRVSYENRPTLLGSGYTYEGIAVITNIIDSESNTVPEPSSAALMGVALAGLALAHGRKG